MGPGGNEEAGHELGFSTGILESTSGVSRKGGTQIEASSTTLTPYDLCFRLMITSWSIFCCGLRRTDIFSWERFPSFIEASDFSRICPKEDAILSKTLASHNDSGTPKMLIVTIFPYVASCPSHNSK